MCISFYVKTFFAQIQLLFSIDRGKYIDFVKIPVKCLTRNLAVTSATRGIKLSLFLRPL